MIAGFMCAPAIADRCLPTGTEPVKVTSRTAGCGIRYSEMSDGVPNTRFSTPDGRPASAKAWTSWTAPAGRQCAAHLAGRRAHWKIPRGERGDHADRLAQDGVTHAGFSRDDATVDS